jgi:hypothetical protein
MTLTSGFWLLVCPSHLVRLSLEIDSSTEVSAGSEEDDDVDVGVLVALEAVTVGPTVTPLVVLLDSNKRVTAPMRAYLEVVEVGRDWA